MWCAQCQADVATEISGDGQALLCTTCGNEVRKGFTPSLHPETKSARELLERWAKEQTTEAAEADSEQVSEAAPVVEAKKPNIRVDGAHELPGRSRPKRRPGQQPLVSTGPRENEPQTQEDKPETLQQAQAQKSPGLQSQAASVHRRRVDELHAAAPRPHFDLNRMPQERTRSGRAEILWGQLLAYGGVGVLTVGTVLVLWGYFGNIESYASTGWLIATAGQMLLLLGIVTLVGGGMQQTTYEVSERIEDLGGRILRIEDSTSQILQFSNYERDQENREEAA